MVYKRGTDCHTRLRRVRNDKEWGWLGALRETARIIKVLCPADSSPAPFGGTLSIGEGFPSSGSSVHKKQRFTFLAVSYSICSHR